MGVVYTDGRRYVTPPDATIDFGPVTVREVSVAALALLEMEWWPPRVDWRWP